MERVFFEDDRVLVTDVRVGVRDGGWVTYSVANLVSVCALAETVRLGCAHILIIPVLILALAAYLSGGGYGG